MKTLVVVTLLTTVLAISGCSNDDATDTEEELETSTTAEAEEDTSETEDSEESESDKAVEEEASDGIRNSEGISDEDYEELVLDCVYGENEAGSCEQLTAAGFDANDAYGLGNSMTQIPASPLRLACLNEEALSCAELNFRVQTASQGGDDIQLTCVFYDAVAQKAGTTLDFMHLRTLLGTDAPVGVLAGLDTLEQDSNDAEALADVEGYLGGICA